MSEFSGVKQQQETIASSLAGPDIHALRVSLGMSLAEFGRELKKAIDPHGFPFAKSYVWKLERGQAEITPEIAQACQVLAARQVTPKALSKRPTEVITSETRNNLIMVMAALGLEPNFKNFEVVAGKLSTVARRSEPWSAKYVHAIYKGYKGMAGSKDFDEALLALGGQIEGALPGAELYETVKVLAWPDQVPENTFIPRSAEVVQCARPGCPVKFVKVNHFQRYHDPECKRLWDKEKRQRGH